MSKLFTTICISLLLVTFTLSVVRADPIEITSGFYTVLRFQGGGSHLIWWERTSSSLAEEQAPAVRALRSVSRASRVRWFP